MSGSKSSRGVGQRSIARVLLVALVSLFGVMLLASPASANPEPLGFWCLTPSGGINAELGPLNAEVAVDAPASADVGDVVTVTLTLNVSQAVNSSGPDFEPLVVSNIVVPWAPPANLSGVTATTATAGWTSAGTTFTHAGDLGWDGTGTDTGETAPDLVIEVTGTVDGPMDFDTDQWSLSGDLFVVDFLIDTTLVCSPTTVNDDYDPETPPVPFPGPYTNVVIDSIAIGGGGGAVTVLVVDDGGDCPGSVTVSVAGADGETASVDVDGTVTTEAVDSDPWSTSVTGLVDGAVVTVTVAGVSDSVTVSCGDGGGGMDDCAANDGLADPNGPVAEDGFLPDQFLNQCIWLEVLPCVGDGCGGCDVEPCDPCTELPSPYDGLGCLVMWQACDHVMMTAPAGSIATGAICQIQVANGQSTEQSDGWHVTGNLEGDLVNMDDPLITIPAANVTWTPGPCAGITSTIVGVADGTTAEVSAGAAGGIVDSVLCTTNAGAEGLGQYSADAALEIDIPANQATGFYEQVIKFVLYGVNA